MMYSQLPRMVKTSEQGESYTVFQAPDGTLIDGRTVEVSSTWCPPPKQPTSQSQEFVPFTSTDPQYPESNDNGSAYYPSYYQNFDSSPSFSTNQAVDFNYQGVQKQVQQFQSEPYNQSKVYHHYQFAKCVRITVGDHNFHVIPFGEIISVEMTPNDLYQICLELNMQFPCDYDEAKRRIWPSMYVNPLDVLKTYADAHSPYFDHWKKAIDRHQSSAQSNTGSFELTDLSKQPANQLSGDYSDYRDGGYPTASSADSVEMRNDFLADVEEVPREDSSWSLHDPTKAQDKSVLKNENLQTPRIGLSSIGPSGNDDLEGDNSIPTIDELDRLLAPNGSRLRPLSDKVSNSSSSPLKMEIVSVNVITFIYEHVVFRIEM